MRIKRTTPGSVENPDQFVTNRSLEMLNIVRQMGGRATYADIALRMRTTSREVEDQCFLLTRAGKLFYTLDQRGREFLETKEHKYTSADSSSALIDSILLNHPAPSGSGKRAVS